MSPKSEPMRLAKSFMIDPEINEYVDSTKGERSPQIQSALPLKAKEGGLDFDCSAKCDQVTTVEKSLLRYPALGALSATSMARIEEQVRIALGLP
jgi:mRNA-degrading endonuclease toxin of MazEF toxin-antitoxin module